MKRIRSAFIHESLSQFSICLFKIMICPIIINIQMLQMLIFCVNYIGKRLFSFFHALFKISRLRIIFCTYGYPVLMDFVALLWQDNKKKTFLSKTTKESIQVKSQGSLAIYLSQRIVNCSLSQSLRLDTFWDLWFCIDIWTLRDLEIRGTKSIINSQLRRRALWISVLQALHKENSIENKPF